MCRSLKMILIIGVILLILPHLSIAEQLKVVRVTDGDTIKARIDGKDIIVRLVGIDAPEASHKKREPGQPFSQKSTKYLADLVLNKSVEIKSYGIDRYGRTLAVVFVDSKNVNLEMVRAGLAEVYRGQPAEGLDLDPYWKAEKAAREAGREMWPLGEKYISPRECRRKMQGNN